MPVQPLSTLPVNAAVFIDSNIFVYAFNGQSKQCRELLARVLREELIGITSFDVISETTHRLMLAEAVDRSLIRKAAARELRDKPDVVTRLRGYWQHIESIFDMDLLIVANNEGLLRDSYTVRLSTGLLTNDSLILAGMRHYGVAFIASNDDDFSRITGITVFRPGDLII